MSTPINAQDMAAAAARLDAAQAPAALDSRPRIQRRYAWLDLPEDGYAGFKAKFCTNFPQRLRADLASNESERMETALREIIVEHNGWLDEDGTPFPLTTDPAFYDAIPTELAAVLITMTQTAAAALPKSLLAMRAR